MHLTDKNRRIFMIEKLLLPLWHKKNIYNTFSRGNKVYFRNRRCCVFIGQRHHIFIGCLLA